MKNLPLFVAGICLCTAGTFAAVVQISRFAPFMAADLYYGLMVAAFSVVAVSGILVGIAGRVAAQKGGAAGGIMLAAGAGALVAYFAQQIGIMVPFTDYLTFLIYFSLAAAHLIASGISMGGSTSNQVSTRERRIAGGLFCVVGVVLVLPNIIALAFAPIVSTGDFPFLATLNAALEVMAIISMAIFAAPGIQLLRMAISGA